jgi:SAM-dependent methyltransferase
MSIPAEASLVVSPTVAGQGPAYPPEGMERLGYERSAYDAWYQAKPVRLERPFYYHHNPRHERAFVRSLLAKNAVGRGSRLLDLGCGNGFYANAFASHGLRVTAVDLSEAVIAYAKRTHPHAVQWIAGDAFALPFDAEFDYAFCHFFTFFNAADDPAEFADYGRAMMRYLRPGGTLWFVWHTDLTAIRLPPDRFSIMNYTIRQLEALFPDCEVGSYAIDGMARLPRYLGRFAYNKYITRLSCAAVYLCASNWRRARVIVAARKRDARDGRAERSMPS